MVLSTAAALAAVGCIATARSSATSIYDDLNPYGQAGVGGGQSLTLPSASSASITAPQLTLTLASLSQMGATPSLSSSSIDTGIGVTLSASGKGLPGDQTLSAGFMGDQPSAAWAPDGRYADVEFTLGMASSSSSFNSLDGANPLGPSQLFLADLDFGQQGSFVQWGLVTSAIPEPSTWTLAGLGGFALGMRFLRRRAGR